MESKFICTYKDFAIIEHSEKQYYLCFEDMAIKQVEPVAALYITNQSITELEDNNSVSRYDVSGELDNQRIYCYWRFIDR